MLSSAALKALETDGIEFLSKGRVHTIRPGEVIVGTPEGESASGRPRRLTPQQKAEATGCEVIVAVASSLSTTSRSLITRRSV